MKKIFFILLILGYTIHSKAQSTALSSNNYITINGYISDSISGEKLIGATVYDIDKKQGAITNAFGFFSLTMKAESANLMFSYIGYKSHYIVVKGATVHTLAIGLASGTTLKTVSVNANRNPIQQQSQMSTIDIPIEQIKKIPALFGEVDVLKVLQLLPGVSKGTEGSSGIFVRGGSPDQNLILLDGVPVYNATHLFGFFSVFNGDAINNVQLVKGGFPARYGGRLSSVIDINMKEGNKNKIKGEGGVGIIASRLTIEGPIKNDKTTFILAGRRTYVDVLTRPISYIASDGLGSVGYYFYDFNAKINHKFSDKDRVFFSGYFGRDVFSGKAVENDLGDKTVLKFGLKWGNRTAALRWNHLLSPKMFMNTTATFSRYKFLVSSGFEESVDGVVANTAGFEYTSGIDDVGLKTDFDYTPISKHQIKLGANWVYHTFVPGINNYKSSTTAQTYDTSFGGKKTYAHEGYLYAEDDWELTTKLKLNAGLHSSAFLVQQKSYGSIQPRLSTRYLLNDKSSLKLSFSKMTQYIHLLSNAGLGLPTDLWLPVTKNIKPQQCWQTAIGYAQTIKADYEVSIEGYYKQMNHLIEYKNGANFFDNAVDWEQQVVIGKGTSYGTEFLVQKKYGRLTGWVGYTLSWSWRTFADKNRGVKYPYKYDRRHDIGIVASYKISKKIDISGTWVFASGNAISLPNQRYFSLQTTNPYSLANQYNQHYSAENVIQSYETINNYRVPVYHRMDAGINFHKPKKWGELVYNISVYNLYNRLNAFFVYSYTNPNTQVSGLKKLTLFPIIPSFSINFKF
jgi:outer membrane cobalamin receptor